MRIFKENQVLWIFMLVAVAIRFVSFFSSVLDHDEITYMIIGRDILHGKDLYADAIDSKPVGIFLIYAFFQLVFGYSIFLKRLAVAILVGITAYIIRNISLKFFEEKRAAFAAGLIYIYYTSTWNSFGLSPNNELFFNFFTVAAIILFFKKSGYNFLGAGLLFGLGFIIKYLVLLDFLAVVSFLFFYEIIREKRISWSVFVPYLLAGIGFALPFLLVNFYFYMGDHFDAFYFITYEFPGRYSDNSSITKYIILILDYIARFLPVSFLFFYVVFSKKSILNGWQKFFLIYWVLAILVAIYLPGKSFRHYSIQLMLPFSLVAGLAFHKDFVFDRFTQKIYTGRTGSILLFLLISSGLAAGIYGKIKTPDFYRQVASNLEKKMDTDETIYVSNYTHALYYLMKKECPTAYVHSTILTNEKLSYAFNVDPKTEIRNVLQKQPDYVVVYDSYPLAQEQLGNQYELEITLDEKLDGGQLLIYSRVSQNNNQN